MTAVAVISKAQDGYYTITLDLAGNKNTASTLYRSDNRIQTNLPDWRLQ